MLVRLGDRVSTHTMENVALVSSQETWLRLHQGDARARWMAFNDAIPRVEKPPLVVWLNMLAWSDLDSANHEPAVLVKRARYVSVAMGFLMIAAIFWMGAVLRSPQAAVIAALSAGSMFFLQRQAHTASYDIHFAAWAALAIAAGLWAINGTGQVPSKRTRVLGWALCAFAMAGSMMSKNPLTLAIVVPPLLMAIACAPSPRRAHALGLAFAAALALLPIGAWYAWVYLEYPDAIAVWRRETTQPRPGDFQPIYYYLGLLALVAPWTLWLIAGLIYGVRASVRQDERASWFAFLWFAFLFILFSIPAAKQQRYILPIIPPAALLVALFWIQPQGSSHRRGAHLMGQVLAAALLVVALAAGPFMAMQDWLVSRAPQLFPERVIEPLNWPIAVVVSAILGGMALVVWQAHRQMHAMRAMLATAAWAITLTTAVWWRYHGAPDRIREVAAYQLEAQRIAALVGDSPVRIVRRGGLRRINEEFRFYFGRLIEPVVARELRADPQAVAGIEFLFARENQDVARLLERLGFTLIDRVHADKDDVLELWRRREPRSHTTHCVSPSAASTFCFQSLYPSRPIRPNVATLPVSTAGWSYASMFSISPAYAVMISHN